MNFRVITATLCVGLLSEAAPAQTVDMTGYRPQPGLVAVSEGGSLAVTWDGEQGQELQARFSIVDGTPTVRELGVRKKGGEWTTLGRDLVPEFGVTTGVRRTGHGLDHEHRWDVFWDAPLNHPDEVRRSSAAFHSDRIEVRTDGARLEVSSPGLSMGSFSGGVRFTVYRGTNLLRVEAIARTDEPSVAYIYQGGLKGFSSDSLPRVLWRDERGRSQRTMPPAARPGNSNVLRARNRLAVAGGKDGSVAVFPPPHQFFFARELEVNLGYVWHRRDGGKTLLARRPPGGERRGLQPDLDRAGVLALQRPAGHAAADAGLLLPQPRRPGCLPGVGHGLHPRRPLQAAARLQDAGHALPHGVHPGVAGLGQPRHDARRGYP